MSWVDDAIKACVEKIDVTADRMQSNFPHKCLNGENYEYEVKANCWTNGYWPGILWMMYDLTKDEKYKKYAVGCEEKLDSIVPEYDMMHHDVGFMWLLTSKPNYVLCGNEMSRKRILFMANTLAGRFNIKGNYIRAWEKYPEDPNQVNGWAIIDCTMNIPLLFIASEWIDDPRFAHVAKAHADTVLKHFLREDGSVNHICEFNAETGEFIRARSGQGYSAESAWARGASWCMHGLALVYGYTKDRKYLDGAKKAADFFYANLPEDYVPYWDLLVTADSSTPRDSSAGANAASGMLEIAKHLDGREKEHYTKMAETILKSLWDNYFISDLNKDPLLKRSTVHYPAGDGIDCSVIYADYYFIEALLKLKGKEEIYNW